MTKKSTRLFWVQAAGVGLFCVLTQTRFVRAETIITETTGERNVVKNPDGSITITHAGTITNETTGKVTNTGSVETVEKTATGHDWTRDANRSNSNGGSSATQTTGTAVNTGNGTGTRTSVTTGSATHPNGKESTWTTDRTGSWQKTATGRDFQRESDRTNGNGATTDRQTTGTVTRTGTGEDITSTTTGEHKAPNGTEKDCTTTRNEQIVNNGNGSKSIDETITRTNSNGQTKTVDKTEQITHPAPGERDAEINRTVNKSPTAPTSPASPGGPSSAPVSATPLAASAKSPSAAATSTASAVALHTRLDDFKKNIENFHRNGRKAEDRAALHSQFEDLRKHWDSNQQAATPEHRRKWGEIRKSMEEVGRGRNRENAKN